MKRKKRRKKERRMDGDEVKLTVKTEQKRETAYFSLLPAHEHEWLFFFQRRERERKKKERERGRK